MMSLGYSKIWEDVPFPHLLQTKEPVGRKRTPSLRDELVYIGFALTDCLVSAFWYVHLSAVWSHIVAVNVAGTFFFLR